MKRDISDLRQEYALKSLDVQDVKHDPIEQFDTWFEEAMSGQIAEPNAMILSTTDDKGRADARTVLLKSFGKNGFSFYTNFESDKGRQLAAQPHCHLLFLWLELQRQVRIKGTAIKLDNAEAELYFQSRPNGSKIGAWASHQSTVIPNREALESSFKTYTSKYENVDDIPKPEYWGGYLIVPYEMEFWQGRQSRLHDRLRYRLNTNSWILERLAP